MHADGRLLAGAQPVAKAGFARVAEVRAGNQGGREAHRGQAHEGKAVVRDFKEALGNVRCEAPGALNHLS